jgi:hypothetical protein
MEEVKMAKIDVTLINAQDGEEWPAEVVVDQPVGWWVEHLLAPLNLPREVSGQPVRYRFVIERTGQVVTEEETLQAAGLREGDIVRLERDPTPPPAPIAPAAPKAGLPSWAWAVGGAVLLVVVLAVGAMWVSSQADERRAATATAEARNWQATVTTQAQTIEQAAATATAEAWHRQATGTTQTRATEQAAVTATAQARTTEQAAATATAQAQATEQATVTATAQARATEQAAATATAQAWATEQAAATATTQARATEQTAATATAQAWATEQAAATATAQARATEQAAATATTQARATEQAAATATAQARTTEQAAATATAAAVPSPTPTATPIPPTATAVPSPTPISYPAPILLEPPNGASFNGKKVTLRWQWAGELGPDEHFDVRVFREGEPHWGIAWTEVTEYLLDLDPMSGGTYYWSIAVLRGKGGKVEEILSPESEVWSFKRTATARSALLMGTPTTSQTMGVTGLLGFGFLLGLLLVTDKPGPVTRSRRRW